MPEQPLSRQAVYTATPQVKVDSQDAPKANQLLIGMEMTEAEGGMSAMELRFSNFASDAQGSADLAFEDDSLLKLGARIGVYCGAASTQQEIFQGLITGIEGDFPRGSPPELVVLAEDVFQRARMSRRTKLHEDVTIAALAQQLAGQLNLTAKVTGFTENIGTQVQLNESDLAFLRRILRRYDGDLQVVGSELQVSPRGDVRRGTVNLDLNSQLRRARATADLAHQVTEVTVTGWDMRQGSRASGTSTGARISPGAGSTGASLLRDRVGQRSEHIGHVEVRNSGEAQAVADAAFDHRARSFVRVNATAEGNPAIRVGTHTTLRGMGGRFDNTYYVISACHRYDMKRGYETDFEAESAYLGPQ
jgi:phage protein D